MKMGKGESKEEVRQRKEELVAVGVDVKTLGQNMQPKKKKVTDVRYVNPNEFAELREIGYELGFDYVESGPLVRSSYHSEKHVFEGYGRRKWMDEKNEMILE